MKINIESCGMTDTGLVRTLNEDSYVVDPKINLFAIADGMGGHNKGEIASHIAIETIHNKFRLYVEKNEKLQNINKDYTLTTNQLLSCVEYANKTIYEKSLESKEFKGMGTTLTSVAINGNKLSLVHIGDSRAYIFRNNNLEQISEDHSYVMDQYKKGLITMEEAENSPYRNVLLKALGVKKETEYMILERSLQEEDIILLASDGLTKMLNNKEIIEIISNCYNDIPAMCSNLITRANKKGGEDNITVITVKIKIDDIFKKIKKIIGK